MEIITTGITNPPKFIIFGSEGSGKSRLTAGAPNALFIRAENRHNHLKVKALPLLSSYNDLVMQLDWLRNEKQEKKWSIIIDTADSMAKFVEEEVCSRNNTDNIMDSKKLAFYAGYVQAANLWENEILPRLSDLNERLLNPVIIICQCDSKSVEHPKFGDHSKYVLGVDKRVAAKLKKWADVIGLLEFKAGIKSQDEKAETVRFGDYTQRILRVKPQPYWDTKESYNLPEFIEIPQDNVGELKGWPSLSNAIRKGISEAAQGPMGNVAAERDAKKLVGNEPAQPNA